MTALIGSTFWMMALAFAIGFVVAGVIKAIAFIADKYDYNHSHKEELMRLKRMRKFRHQLALASASRIHNSESYHGVSKGVPTGDLNDFYQSEGSTDYGLMDYYYPSKSQIELIEKEIEEEDGPKKRKFFTKTSRKPKAAPSKAKETAEKPREKAPKVKTDEGKKTKEKTDKPTQGTEKPKENSRKVKEEGVKAKENSGKSGESAKQPKEKL